MGIFVDCDVCGECDNCEIVDGQYLCGLCWFDYEREKDEEDAIYAEDDDYDDLIELCEGNEVIEYKK